MFISGVLFVFIFVMCLGCWVLFVLFGTMLFCLFSVLSSWGVFVLNLFLFLFLLFLLLIFLGTLLGLVCFNVVVFWFIFLILVLCCVFPSFLLLCGFVVMSGLECIILYMATSRFEFFIVIMLCGHFGLMWDWVGFINMLFLCKWGNLCLFCKCIGLLLVLILLLFWGMLRVKVFCFWLLLFV